MNTKEVKGLLRNIEENLIKDVDGFIKWGEGIYSENKIRLTLRNGIERGYKMGKEEKEKENKNG